MLKEITEFHGKDIYQVKAVLERCSAYTLYLVQAKQSGQFFMIKTLDQDVYRLEQWLRREGNVLSSLRSPYIVQLCDIGQAEGHIFLVMELVHGRLLSDWGTEQEQIDEFMAVQFLRQMAQALKDSHYRGIVHQAIGPDCLFICPPFSNRDEIAVKLWDFGLASARKSSLANDPDQGGTRLGFWAPEKVNYESETTAIDVRTDIYGAGAIIYWLLTGSPPYEAENPGRLVMKIADPTIRPAPLHEVRSDLSRNFIQLVHECLETDVNKRIASPRDLLSRLEGLASTSDHLNYLYHQAKRAAELNNWTEVDRLAQQAEQERGGSILFQELSRQAKQMLEKETVDNVHNTLYNVRELVTRGQFQQAELKLRRLEETATQRPDLAEKYNLTPAIKEQYAYIQANKAFKPAQLVSIGTHGNANGHQERTYPLVKATHKLGRRNGEHSDPLQDLDLIDLTPEPKGTTVSRTQAWLTFRDGEWFIKPNPQSMNQTSVNSNLIVANQEHPLANQDTLNIGEVALEFRLSAES